jgi:hypothetical protein
MIDGGIENETETNELETCESLQIGHYRESEGVKDFRYKSRYTDVTLANTDRKAGGLQTSKC